MGVQLPPSAPIILVLKNNLKKLAQYRCHCEEYPANSLVVMTKQTQPFESLMALSEVEGFKSTGIALGKTLSYKSPVNLGCFVTETNERRSSQ